MIKLSYQMKPALINLTYQKEEIGQMTSAAVRRTLELRRSSSPPYFSEGPSPAKATKACIQTLTQAASSLTCASQALSTRKATGFKRMF